MPANFTLDELILQYSDSPFIDERMVNSPCHPDQDQKQKMLSRLLFIANNLFSMMPVRELGSYKRRYEFK